VTVRIRPVRFTHDVPGRRRFLEAIGLTARISGGGWVDFTSPTSGMAALHGAPGTITPYQAGETSLSFEADEPLERSSAQNRSQAAVLAGARSSREL
jgi:hypothetical protein